MILILFYLILIMYDNNFINVKRLEIFAGKIYDNKAILIEDFINEETDDKYLSYTVLDKQCITNVYKYPDINPILYELIQYIQNCGTSYTINNKVYGPNLINTFDRSIYYIFDLINDDNNLIIDYTDIVSKNTPIELQTFIESII